MDFAAKHVHISLELGVGVLVEAVDDAWVVGHLVLVVEANVLRLPHFVGTVFFALLLEEKRMFNTFIYKIHRRVLQIKRMLLKDFLLQSDCLGSSRFLNKTKRKIKRLDKDLHKPLPAGHCQPHELTWDGIGIFSPPNSTHE